MPSGSGEAANPARFSGLDGLRALAVAAVVAYHLFPQALPGGFVGVDVFFVISGFLITRLLVAERDATGRISLGRFWQRRVRRLVPALAIVVVASCTAAWVIEGDVLVGLGWQVLGAATFSYNWLSIASDANYFSASAPELLRNLWSLAVEEQFYLVWPIALLGLLLLRNARLRIALVAGLAMASGIWMAALYEPGGDPTRVYYGSDTHGFGLTIGATLALLTTARPLARPIVAAAFSRFEDRVLPWVGIVALLGIVLFFWFLPETDSASYRGGLFIASLLTAAVILAAIRGRRLGRFLDTAPLRFIGERSYGIYLWHWPVIVLVRAVWPARMSDPGAVVGTGLVALIISVVAALLSYRLLEQPIRRHGLRGLLPAAGRIARRSRTRRQFVAAAAVLGVLLCVGTGAAIVSAPETTTAQTRIQQGQEALDASPPSAPPPSTPTPTLARIPGGDQITAVGDSVMLASAPELQAAFPGIAIDASVSRGLYAAPDILSALDQAGALRTVVVLGLGTNGPIEQDSLDRVLDIVGPDRSIVLVNAFADRDWTVGVNEMLADCSARNRNVELANWHDAIATHTDVLADDNIHPGPTGAQIYADSIMAALRRLVEPPPLPGPGGYR
ncbi:acyltransferase family protein [Luethyella okanaganae]|uniref:Acyltransferase family protein n=1 Tax=Luethyella okanaganae TaxID=69372 RepID=A0ABW1VIQ9_9MICO